MAVNQERPALLRLFRLVARLDAWQGLASTLSEFGCICSAERSADNGFALTEVYHPLLAIPVANTIQSDGNSLLFTGTNMAGKTTFIKALAINALLAQTVGFCMARKAVLPWVRLRTLLNRDDSVMAGQSYFFFEALLLLRLQGEGNDQDYVTWFVLDELFRGTNTVERVAASTAVLAHLARQGLVIATTHDTQLVSLLEPQFKSYHFSEILDERGARFDYKLRDGRCSTRNAIKLLALAGYPKEVIETAEQIANRGIVVMPELGNLEM